VRDRREGGGGHFKRAAPLKASEKGSTPEDHAEKAKGRGSGRRKKETGVPSSMQKVRSGTLPPIIEKELTTCGGSSKGHTGSAFRKNNSGSQ